MASFRWFSALPFLLVFAAPEARAYDAVLDCLTEGKPPVGYKFTVKPAGITAEGQGGDFYNIDKANFVEWKEKREKDSYIFVDQKAGMALLVDRDAKPTGMIGVLMAPFPKAPADTRKPVPFDCKLTKGNLNP